MKYFLPIFLLLLLLFPAVTGLWPQDREEYVNKRLGIAFSYPVGWECREETQQVLVLSPSWDSKGQERAAFGIQIINLEFAEDKAVESYFAELMQDDSYTHSQPDRVTIAGKSWFHAGVADKEQNSSGEFFLLKENDVLYFIVTVFEPAGAKERFFKTIDSMVKSFKIIPAHRDQD